MDQFIFFIIIYIIYMLFGMLQKRMRGGASTQSKKQRRPRPPAAGKHSPQPQLNDAEIPEFLSRMLGLDIEKKPAPIPQKSSPPEIIRGEKKYEVIDDWDETVESDPDLPSSAEGGHVEASLTKLIHKTEAHEHAKPYKDPYIWKQAPREKSESTASKSTIISMLKNPDSIRKAIVLREILDRPVGTRRYRLPSIG